MRTSTAALLLATTLLHLLGCLVTDDTPYEDRRACILSFEATDQPTRHDLTSDCGGTTRAATVEVRDITLRLDQPAATGPIHGVVRTYAGEVFVQSGTLTSDCEATSARLRLDLSANPSQGASAHGAYRCDLNLALPDTPQRCTFTLADGPRLPDTTCTATIHPMPGSPVYRSGY